MATQLTAKARFQEFRRSATLPINPTRTGRWSDQHRQAHFPLVSITATCTSSLIAPLTTASLGLLTPVVAQAADVNLAGVNQYAAEEQVTSISQFSDVQPTDWAYQ
ncbi:MAG: hypothetical protein ACO3SO_12295, partial [Luteolibacter sp.]